MTKQQTSLLLLLLGSACLFAYFSSNSSIADSPLNRFLAQKDDISDDEDKDFKNFVN
jgi:hypothetical protein